MLDRCDSFNGAIIISCRCDKLLILGYISVQRVDSKVGQMIYELQRVDLMKFMQYEPIPIRNICLTSLTHTKLKEKMAFPT